jgi:hypothetical protein
VLSRKLEEKNSELVTANDALRERIVLAEFHASVNSALTHGGTLHEILQLCADTMVQHLDAAFAGIWTLNSAENLMELQASAGMYTHTDSRGGRIAGRTKRNRPNRRRTQASPYELRHRRSGSS